MAYATIKQSVTEYQGESFSKSFDKSSKAAWEDYEIGAYALYDTKGNEITTGSLVKSDDSQTLSLQIGYTITENLEGKYLLLVYLMDANDPDFKDVIAEYTITYKARKV